MLENAAAAIALDDRSFRYGDGLFETILLRRGAPYLWEKHLDRLSRGAAILGLPFRAEQLLAEVTVLLRANRLDDGVLRISLGRGRGGRGYRPPQSSAPLLVIECFPLPAADRSPLRVGVSDYRRIPTACLPNDCKTAQGLNAILALQQAIGAGFDEALQLSVDGHVSSFASGNLFWKSGDRLFTPSLSTGCLAGVTRQRLTELFPAIREIDAPLESLREAGAIVLTNSIVLCRAAGTLGDRDYPESEALAASWRRALIEDSENDAFAMKRA